MLNSLIEGESLFKDCFRLTDIENRLVVAKGKGEWGKEGLGVWD